MKNDSKTDPWWSLCTKGGSQDLLTKFSFSSSRNEVLNLIKCCNKKEYLTEFFFHFKNEKYAGQLKGNDLIVLMVDRYID